MRRRSPLLLVPAVLFAGVGLVASLAGCEELAQSLGTGTSSASTSDAAATDAATTGDASVVGGGCGTETTTGIALCTATSVCPTVVVDTEAMPHCGFRIRGSVVDLVCGCNGSYVCAMGSFASCDEAAALLKSRSEAEVCAEISTGACTTTTSTTTTTTTSSSSSSSSGGTTTTSCRECVAACGGGAACAAVCNC